MKTPAPGIQKADYQVFFEKLDLSCLGVDTQGRVCILNQSARRFFNPQKDEVLTLTPESVRNMLAQGPEGKPFPLSITGEGIQAALTESLILQGRVVAVTSDEEPLYYLVIHAVPLMNEEDVQELRERELRRSLNRSGWMPLVWVLDKNYRYISFNDAHKQEMKRVWGADIHVGMNIMDCLTDVQYRRLVSYNYTRALSGEHFYTVDEIKDENGNYRHFENILGPIFDDQGQINGLQIQTTELMDPADVNDRLQLNIGIQETLIAGYNDVGICTLDRFYRYRAFNDAYRRFMVDIRGAKIRIGVSLIESLPTGTVQREVREKIDRVFQGEPLTELRSYPGTQGSPLFSENRYFPVLSNQGAVVGVTIFTKNVTRMMLQERTALRAQQENEILHKEIHNRVKSNLQVVSSLVNLQMHESPVPLVREQFEILNSRIRGMAMVHEQLYQEKELTGINLRDFVRRICMILVDALNVDTKRIRLSEDLDEFYLEPDVVIPLGQILIELLSNSFRYAFPGDGPGNLEISLRKKGRDLVRCSVSDSGRVPWRGEPPENHFGLGLNLVSILVRQLGGELEFDFSGGTRVSFSFYT